MSDTTAGEWVVCGRAETDDILPLLDPTIVDEVSITFCVPSFCRFAIAASRFSSARRFFEFSSRPNPSPPCVEAEVDDSGPGGVEDDEVVTDAPAAALADG
jgi:hypothetical protein